MCALWLGLIWILVCPIFVSWNRPNYKSPTLNRSMKTILTRSFSVSGMLVFLMGVLTGFFVGYYFASSLLMSNTHSVQELRHEVEMYQEELNSFCVKIDKLTDSVVFQEMDIEKIKTKINLTEDDDEEIRVIGQPTKASEKQPETVPKP